MGEETGTSTGNANEVYVLLKKNYRISRNIRLIWFFNNILKDLTTLPRVLSKDGQIDDSESHEIQVLSWTSEQPISNVTSRTEEPVLTPKDRIFDEAVTQCTPKYPLQPETKVQFVSRGYRLVVALDLSPSIFRVSTQSCLTIAEELLARLAECLCSLIEPFQVPLSDIKLHPNIYVTIFTHTRQSHLAKGRYKQDIIVQGSLLTPKSITCILRNVECKIYHEMKAWNLTHNLESSQPVRHDHGLVNMLRTGILALQLLPTNTSAGIIVVTDGVVGMPDMAVLDTLINQLRSSTTSCSVLHLKSSKALFCDYAFCKSIELLKFISSATYGTFFDSDVSYTPGIAGGVNSYQKGLLIWQFQLDDETKKFSEKRDIRNWEPEADLRYTPKQKNMYIAPVLRKKHYERTLRVSIFSLLSVRLREGYMITSMSLGKSGNQLEVKLRYPWNHSASIVYIATAAWPVVRSHTKVEVFIEATYEFLFDVTTGLRQENPSRYRGIVVRRFTLFMKGLSQTDHMMAHLLSFTSDPVHYRINQKHVPLFYLPPNSTQLVLSMMTGNDSSQSMFSVYWKPILSMDPSVWQKWMHTHHIDLVLQHDIPLPKHLHILSKSGRFHSVQSSCAMSQVTSLLRDWCTFVLLENHSYVRFTYKENEERPSSFFIVRLSNKAPVVVIRLAFVIGMPGTYRNQILSELKDRILSLTFPSATKHSQNLNLRTAGMRSRNPSAQMRPRHISGSERTCATLFHKPLDRIVIRYDQAPRDFLRPPSSAHRRGKGFSTVSSRNGHLSGGEVSSTSLMQDLCRYLEHHRCVWSITNRSSTPIPLAVAGQMAGLLIKLRLSEGFNFASSSSGVISMIREFTMSPCDDEKSTDSKFHCLAQFIIFPPTVCTSRESFSLDGSGDEEEDGAEADGELFLATEMWIEPQCGIVITDDGIKPLDSAQDSRPPNSHGGSSGRSSRLGSLSSSATTCANSSSQPYQRFLGSSYCDISKIVADEDKALLSVLVTLEHLRLMCLPKSPIPSTLPQSSQKSNTDCDKKQRSRKRSAQTDTDGRSTPTDAEHPPTVDGISHFPCLFDLVGLLDRCPHVKLLFMTLSQTMGDINENVPTPNTSLFKLFHNSLGKISDREVFLSEDDFSGVTQHIIRRENEVNGSGLQEEIKMQKPSWKCFLKVLSKAKVMVILVPSSSRDLQNLATNLPGLVDMKPNCANGISEALQPGMVAESNNIVDDTITENAAQENPVKDVFENPPLSRDDYRLARRRSIKRISSVLSSWSNEEKDGSNNAVHPQEQPETHPQINLPVFVYKCSMPVLVDQLVKDPLSTPHQRPELDIEQDYRPSFVRDRCPSYPTSPQKKAAARLQSSLQTIKSVDSKIEPESSRHRFFRSHSSPFHPAQNLGGTSEEMLSPSAEHGFGSITTPQQKKFDLEASSLYETIVDSYHSCFVRAVLNNLRSNNGSNVASVDVQAATDAICFESVQEIDITQFLLITCPQVANFKNQHLSREMLDQRDHDDVFSLGPHIPVTRSEPVIRHTSSTSSNTDPSQVKAFIYQNKSTSESPEQTTRGSKHQVSGMTVDQSISESWKTKEAEKPGVRSAFKKLRRRPQSLPKSRGTVGKERSDTDGDTPESEFPAFLPLSINDSKASSERDMPNMNNSSLPRSLKVEKPLRKVLITSKVEWEDLPEFPIDLLQESHPRHISGTDDQVKTNFFNLLSSNFHPIQSLPDIFYYKPQDWCSEEALDDDHNTNVIEVAENEVIENEAANGLAMESDQDVKFELGDDDKGSIVHPEASDQYITLSSDMEKTASMSKTRKVTKRRKQPSTNLQQLVEDFGLSSGSTSSLSSDSYSEEDDGDVPLFLCMTCSVRDKKTGNHGTMVVDGIPTSLQHVLSKFENPCDSVDISQLCITLDLIWMMLPADMNEYNHIQDVENRFSSGLLPEEDDSPRHGATGPEERNQTVHEEQEPVDPISTLPSTCLKAVNYTKEQIEWLLKDEIISALRTCESIDNSTLEKVAMHVEESAKENCMVETTNLQFVFGTEKSFQLFNSLFERMFKDFKDYRMKKEGQYYYFTTERTFLPIQNWPIDQFMGESGNYQPAEQVPAIGDLELYSQNIPSVNGSTSSGGKSHQDVGKDGLECVALRRTRTAPNSLRSPSSRLALSTKSCTSFPASAFHSSLSFRSLPNNEMMSVDAIESDVTEATKAPSLTKKTGSSQSTPVRKTSSAMDVISPDVSVSPNNNEKSSPNIQLNVKTRGRNDQSRLSLPNAVTSMFAQIRSDAAKKSSKKKGPPVKQRSVESNLNLPERGHLKRHSSHAIAPLSSRNSPQKYSGATSPLVSKQGHNCSFGSGGSAPSGRRRSSQSVTPVTQLLQRDTLTIGSEPNSSTPLGRRDNSAVNDHTQGTARASAHSAHLFSASAKDTTSSPVSLSDGEFHRYSTASWFESGYDAEVSNSEDEDGCMGSLDGVNDLPSFWLVVHVLSDRVQTYFHRRNSAVVAENIKAEHKRVFDAVIEYIHATCKRVNQTLLLLELHDSRMCNALLVEETEEDIWRQDYQSANFGLMDDHGYDADGALLAATMTNAPGQFACDCVLETVIPLHPRLKTTGNVAGKSSVIAAVRDLVINFMVTNRKNMFIYLLSDKSVFYCRIEEDTGPQSGKADSRRSSQLLQTSTPMLEGFGTDPSDRRTSRESLISLGQIEPKPAGTLTLRWHGVGPLSPQQQQELEKMNRSIVRRLNDSVLEKITVTLQRSSKLTSSDVQFIQPTVFPVSVTANESPVLSRTRQVSPDATLSYGLPDEFCSCLSAVRYYLRQNLLQFMAVPRYADTTQTSGQFVAYRTKMPTHNDSGSKSILQPPTCDGSVFLFHQSIEPGKTGYGIACVVLEISDQEGNQVPSESSPKLDVKAQTNISQLVNLTEVFDSQRVSNISGSRSNTPAMVELQPLINKRPFSAVKYFVRFHLWLKGSLALVHLNKRLRPAIRHSLFDTITELLILRPPLCDFHTNGKPEEDDLTPMEILKSKKQKQPDRRKSTSAQVEEGEIGTLKEFYRNSPKDWFDAMEKSGSPSVFKLHLDLTTVSYLKEAVQDLQKIFGTTIGDCKIRLFACPPDGSKMSAFTFGRNEMDENCKTPARYTSYILIARNFPLWRKAVGYFCLPDQHLPTKTAKFPPHDSTMRLDQSPRMHEHRLTAMRAAYVPRQQFVMVHIHLGKVEMWSYNVSNEIARNLQVKLSYCINFHNARRRVLDCITFQKMSLFRHCSYETGFSTSSNGRKGSNPFTQDVKDVDLVLVNSKLPSDNELQSQRKSKSNKRAFFNEAYFSNVPVRPLSISDYGQKKDVTTQYAKQYHEVKTNLKKRGEEQQHLYRVFSNWQERPAAISNTFLTKDILQVLLRHARVMHHVTSPILFSPYWRKQILKIKETPSCEGSMAEQQKETPVTKRQKRLSGVIRKSGDFTGKNLDDAKSRSRSNSTRKGSVKEKVSSGNLTQLVSETLEGNRYNSEELHKALMMQYVQYWQSMHFILVKEDKRTRSERSLRKSSSTERNGFKNEKIKYSTDISTTKPRDSVGKSDEMKRPLYLYRVSAGGIVIVEISLGRKNFSVKLHALEASRLQHQQNLNQQMKVLFLNECEHLKDLTHVHSFMYDFHLRYVQMYVQERQTAIRPGYHLVSLLEDFSHCYKTLPSCAFNQLYHGTVKASCSHVTADELYEYIVGRQASHHGFKTLKLVHHLGEKNEHALVSAHLIFGHMHSPSCNKEEHDTYDIGYVIWHDKNKPKESKIQLNFSVLFTNRRHLFPRLDRHENHPQTTFATRRGSSNVALKTSSGKNSISDDLSNSAISLNQQGLSPTSQSTSSLVKLATPHHGHSISGAQILSTNTASPDVQYTKPESMLTPPTLAYKRLLAQGRRQSMPNVGAAPLGNRQGKQVLNLAQYQKDPSSLKMQLASSSPDQLKHTALPAFVECEMSRLKDYLKNLCASAEIQCYRNQLWDKVYMDKPLQSKASSLPMEDFEHLLKHCQKIPLSKLDARGHSLCNLSTMQLQWAIGLQKHMLARFDRICRYFTNGDGTKRYLGILNPKLYHMMFLVTIDTIKEQIGMFVVMRDKQAELDKEKPNLSSGNANLIPLLEHLNHMIDFMCYHTWTILLSS